MQELCVISTADSRVKANIEFLNNLINGRLDASALLSSINIKVPSRVTRHGAPFEVPVHTTNYGRNSPLHHMMRLANKSTIYQGW